MTALPATHVAASRLAWRVARELAKRGWLLATLHLSRRWRFRVGSSSWIAQASVSFFFDEPNPARRGAVYAVDFEGKGSRRSLERSRTFEDLRRNLGEHYTYGGGRLAFAMRDETRPRALLAEMDRIAREFGSDDRHRVPRSRARNPTASLWTIGEAVLAHGEWTLETPAMRLPRGSVVWASLSPMPASWRRRAELSSFLFISDGRANENVPDLIARAAARGYTDAAGRKHPDVALMKLQPLSARAALAEAKFLERARM